ncbi:MAG: hypothetical protein MR605_01050, partial [Bacteroidales bacterium]|nr:hypothetical protein [Bacteroidales bacterium]
SEEKIKTVVLLLFFSRLALLCFAKIGCGSEEKIKTVVLLLFFSRLALSLPPKWSKILLT